MWVALERVRRRSSGDIDGTAAVTASAGVWPRRLSSKFDERALKYCSIILFGFLHLVGLVAAWKALVRTAATASKPAMTLGCLAAEAAAGGGPEGVRFLGGGLEAAAAAAALVEGGMGGRYGSALAGGVRGRENPPGSLKKATLFLWSTKLALSYLPYRS